MATQSPKTSPPEISNLQATAILVQPSSPRYPSASTHLKIGIAVDLSDESSFPVHWAVHNYLRPGDSVVLLAVRPTSVLYGADWGTMDMSLLVGDESLELQQRPEDEFDSFTNKKANDLAQPLVESEIPFKIHIVKDHDMKERRWLEVERLGLSAVVMGSRGFEAAAKGRLGSVSDYCVHHCGCPVIVVRFPEEEKQRHGGGVEAKGRELRSVAEEQEEIL